MLSIRGFLVLLSIPIKLLIILIKYPFVGGMNERFKNDLKNSLKLMICRTALSMPVLDSSILSILSNHFLLNKLLKSLYPKLTKPLNNYGKSFDKQSFWIVESPTRSKSDPILIYLHGGGYYFETMPSQLESLLSIYYLLDTKAKARSNLSILLLDYKLASKGYKMTTQLHELLDTYENLVKLGNTNFIFMGDSAGGNLSLIFLQYIKQHKLLHLPYPKSLILISPWVKINPDVIQGTTKGHSYHDNSPRDMIQYHLMGEEDRQVALMGEEDWQSLIVSPGNYLPYKHSDWEDISTFTDENNSVFVIMGEHEVFRDDILDWCQWALKSPLRKQSHDSNGKFDKEIHQYIGSASGCNTEIVIEPWGVHDSALFFENHIISKIRKYPNLNINSLDQKEFFGIIKITQFLNTIL